MCSLWHAGATGETLSGVLVALDVQVKTYCTGVVSRQPATHTARSAQLPTAFLSWVARKSRADAANAGPVPQKETTWKRRQDTPPRRRRSRPIPPLLCPHCGGMDVPVLGPGAGKHVARALCSGCGRYLKWLPKSLLGLEKETRPMSGIARCTIVGCIGRYGVEVRYATSGAPCASFILVVSERGRMAKCMTCMSPVRSGAKRQRQPVNWRPARLRLFEGKLAKRKKGEQWEMVVAGFEVTPILAPHQFQASMEV